MGVVCHPTEERPTKTPQRGSYRPFGAQKDFLALRAKPHRSPNIYTSTELNFLSDGNVIAFRLGHLHRLPVPNERLPRCRTAIVRAAQSLPPGASRRSARPLGGGSGSGRQAYGSGAPCRYWPSPPPSTTRVNWSPYRTCGPGAWASGTTNGTTGRRHLR